MPGFGDNRVAHVGRHVVQTRRRGHPARGTIRSRPLAAQTAIGAYMLVEPRVTVGRAHPLRLAPREERIDERVRVAQLLEPPRARVGNLDADAPQERLHLLGASEITFHAPRRVAQHVGVAPGALGHGVCIVARPRADQRGDERLGHSSVDRQAVDRQLGAQQLRGRFSTGGHRGAPRVAQLGQASLLIPGREERQLRPRREVLEGLRPAAVDPVGPEIAVAAGRHVGFVVAVLGVREQVERSCFRERVDCEVMQLCPHPRRVRVPSAEDQPMDRGNVPRGGDAYAVVNEHDGSRARPHDPSRSKFPFHVPHDVHRIGDRGGHGERATSRGHRDTDAGRERERDEIAGSDAARA